MADPSTPTPIKTPEELTAEMHEVAGAVLRQINPDAEKRVIQVPEDDARIGQEAAGELAAVYQQIGEEYMRHRFQIADLTRALADKDAAYTHVVQMLSKKHITERGQFNFMPDIGAFVGFVPKTEQGE